MIDVVVDTNVLVVDMNALAAAFRSSLGACCRLLQTIEGRQWRPVISPAPALEYESVLKRGIGELGLSPGDVDDFIEYLCSRARLVQIYFRWRAPVSCWPSWEIRDECQYQRFRRVVPQGC